MPATSFVALYRGASVSAARLIAVSADPTLVAAVSQHLLSESRSVVDDAVLARLEHGRRAALRLMHTEIGDDHPHHP